jgi:hypothetical protein
MVVQPSCNLGQTIVRNFYEKVKVDAEVLHGSTHDRSSFDTSERLENGNRFQTAKSPIKHAASTSYGTVLMTQLINELRGAKSNSETNSQSVAQEIPRLLWNPSFITVITRARIYENRWRGSGKWLWGLTYKAYYSRIYLKRLRNWSPGRNLNSGHPEYRSLPVPHSSQTPSIYVFVLGSCTKFHTHKNRGLSLSTHHTAIT